MKGSLVFDLHGTVAVVTGGNGGIGLGMAKGLAQAGAAIAIWGRNLEKNAAALADFEALGAKATAHVVDVASEQQVVAAMEQTLAAHGRLDTLVANAGVGTPYTKLPEQTLQVWRDVLSVNLEGVFLCMREASKVLIEQGEGGSLMAVGSVGALRGMPGRQAYGAAKAGVISLVQGMAIELGRHRIRVNAVLPGWIETDMLDDVVHRSSNAATRVDDAVMARVPLRRYGKPEEFAGIAVYLASSASSFHTADVITVDGGFLTS